MPSLTRPVSPHPRLLQALQEAVRMLELVRLRFSRRSALN